MKNTTAMADYELRHIEALRKDLAGCTVLLKKDGSFPLEKPCTLAAYGSGVRRTIRGGTGSGEVNSRYIVTIEEGLQQAGFTLTGMEWHTGYEQAREKAHKAFLKQLKKDAKAAKQNFILYGMGKVMPEPEYDLPLNAEGDAAIYVVSRISGEGNDRTPLKGDIRLTDSEVRDILALDKKFTRFMLVLNVGGVVDLSPVMSVRNILLLSQLGVETGGALADILLGKANPSGKLTTTWAAFEEYPEMPDFEDMNETRYREGIYVGYRYFDTFRKQALFPFGYGLSYTEFRLGAAGVEANGAQVTVRTTVENTGTMAGRQVVQVYLSKPAGKLDVPRQELCAFAKTRTLAPGEAETVTCSFTLPEMAAYDAETASYILEAGDHLVRVGVSSAETVPAAVLHLDKTVTTLQAKNVLGSTDFTDLTAPAAAMERPEGVPVIEIDPASIVCETIDYAHNEEILPEVDALTKEDAALLLIGNFDPNAKGFASMIGTAGRHVCGAAGESCSTVKGIPWLIMADGPAGLRLAKEYYEDGKGKHAVGNASVPDSIMEMLSGPMKLVMSLMGGNGKPKAGCEIKTQYCTAIPIGTALAQSFDTDFVQRCGGIVGEEMEHFGVHLWLAPALNIHRSIRCGRNFEYYSEDPLVSGKMAAAMTRGVQAHKGSVTARTKAVVHRGSKAHKNRPGGCLQLTIACMKCQRFLTDMSCQKSQGGVPVRRRPGYILIARNDLLRLCPLHIPGCLFPAETILEHQLLNNLAGVHPHAFENISSARNACIPSSLHTIVIDTFAVIAHSLKLALKITQYKLSVLFAQFQRVSHLVKAHSSSHKLLDIFKQVCQAPFFTAFVRQFFHNAAHTAHSFVCIFVFCHLIGKNCIVHAFWICTEEIVHNRSNRIFASILSVHINDMCLVLKRCRQFPNRTVNMVERQCTLEIVVFRDEDHIRFRKIFQSFARPCNIGVHHGTVVTRPLR